MVTTETYWKLLKNYGGWKAVLFFQAICITERYISVRNTYDMGVWTSNPTEQYANLSSYLRLLLGAVAI